MRHVNRCNHGKQYERKYIEQLAGGYWRYVFYCIRCMETLRMSDEQPPEWETKKKKGQR